MESGVARSEAVAEVVRFAELTGARVYQGWMSDVNFPVTHPQYLGDLEPTSPEAASVLAETDVLIGVGCSLFSHGFLPGDAELPAGLRLIHVDDDPWEIGKNLPTDCGLLGDIKATLAELNESLESALTDDVRRTSPRACREDRGAEARHDRSLEVRAGVGSRHYTPPHPPTHGRTGQGGRPRDRGRGRGLVGLRGACARPCLSIAPAPSSGPVREAVSARACPWPSA